jgi:hypothetical protein
MFLALSSWEGKISDEDLEKVDTIAPLMRIFGYKPEVHVGEYDQFISKTSQQVHVNLHVNELKYNYTIHRPKTYGKHKKTFGPEKPEWFSPKTFHSYWTAPAFRIAAERDEF